MMNLTCCVSCGVGSSTREHEVPAQTKKFGEYICIPCEESLNKILEAKDGLQIDKGYGSPAEGFITEENVYYSDGSRVKDPKSSWLGFGGSWFLVIKKYKTKLGYRQEMFVTNNLWHNRRIPKGFQSKLKESGAIDSTVIGVNKKSLENLRDTLNNIPYFNKEEK